MRANRGSKNSHTRTRAHASQQTAMQSVNAREVSLQRNCSLSTTHTLRIARQPQARRPKNNEQRQKTKEKTKKQGRKQRDTKEAELPSRVSVSECFTKSEWKE